MLKTIETALNAFTNFVWGMPLLVLLVGGGLFFVFYSRFLPYRHLRHSFKVLRGDFDDPNEPGDIPHYQALSGALSGTLGLGNIAGVAVAIHAGGPGAIFWMWVTALVGVATKYFTCTLSIMYRGTDSEGHLQGGTMYFIREGLGRRWYVLAAFFSLAGMFGTLPAFQINQLTQIVRDVVAVPYGLATAEHHFTFDFLFGLLMAGFIGYVIFGGVKRVGAMAGRLVPGMVILYLLATLFIIAVNIEHLPGAIALIFTDAFTGKAVAGGLVGTVIMGVRQGAFSNEAGIGTAPLAHGAAQTHEPVREGMVAMLGPLIDTIIVCTCTALVILLTGVWQTADNGVVLTDSAFQQAMGPFGAWLLTVIVVFFSVTTMFTFWYYGAKCLGFLIGAHNQHWYRYLYLALVVGGSVVSIKAVVGLLTGFYGLMAIPTMIATLMLAPKVMEATRDYFRRFDLHH
ncbi:MAG: alanine/glycine:cation symporter family protein [Gammaproteobacteria bacterium]|jgi:AGCS family alanine or glycine:cation symporter